MNNLILNLYNQINSIILGKNEQIKLCISCILADGHLLIEDIPGIGKTTLAKVLAKTLGLKFTRIQCTNDMLPSDIIGVSIFDQKSNSFSFHKGPIFTEVLLTDEINRATPKTQSALLEAMEERQISIDSNVYKIPRPFFVIGTQNPTEQAGTYPLPESQLDRFLMKISLGYPSKESEIAMLEQGGARNKSDEINSLLDLTQIIKLQDDVRSTHISKNIYEYIQNILDFTRKNSLFLVGLSPRAGLSIISSAKSYAFIEGRDYVIPEDIQAVLPYVTIHRLRKKESHTYYSVNELVDIFKNIELPK